MIDEDHPGYAALTRAELAWGRHPWGWDRPPYEMPRWWQFMRRIDLRAFEAVFGPIDDAALDRFWTQYFLGQSIHEDAGGALLRCYRAMLGLPVGEVVTYEQYAADLFSRKAKP